MFVLIGDLTRIGGGRVLVGDGLFWLDEINARYAQANPQNKWKNHKVVKHPSPWFENKLTCDCRENANRFPKK
jgi:hypothetical protein